MTHRIGSRHWARKARIAAWAVVSSVALAAFQCASLPAFAQASQIATHTTLTAQAHASGDHTLLTYNVAVTAEDGTPATGIVQLEEHGKAVAATVLDSSGHGEIRADNLTGDHSLQAAYVGDTTHAVSQSDLVAVHADATAAPTFSLSINPSTITVATPGDASSLVATITPQNGFTGFISLSCSGTGGTTSTTGGANLPVGVGCTFTPANLEITANTTTATADMVLQTTTGSQIGQNTNPKSGMPRAISNSRPVFLAVLIPGVGVAFFIGRRRKVWMRAGLFVVLLLIGSLGMTACNPRYSYLKHQPTFTGTQPGTYPLLVTAQTSNGVTATTQSVSLTLTVQ